MLHRRSTAPVRSGEQVAKSAAQPVGDPALGEVLWPVKQHVAALAQARQVARAIVGRVVAEMSGSQHHPGHTLPGGPDGTRRRTRPPAPGAPLPGAGVQPAPFRQARDQLPVRPPAPLATSAGPAEADRPAQLGQSIG